MWFDFDLTDYCGPRCNFLWKGGIRRHKAFFGSTTSAILTRATIYEYFGAQLFNTAGCYIDTLSLIQNVLLWNRTAESHVVVLPQGLSRHEIEWNDPILHNTIISFYIESEMCGGYWACQEITESCSENFVYSWGGLHCSAKKASSRMSNMAK